MKIRIKDNSIRFRLTKSEVADLGQKGFVKSVTQFKTGLFSYSIERTDENEMDAAFVENQIVLKLPKAMIHELVNTERIGYEAQSGAVKLLVEKDFVCIDNTTEDQSDNYPNPSLNCQ
ncbi:hypothetical protein LL912_17840 [Niabella sp. CC-SYL272]|uniref:DUF7009 family protein n=1 Tax=Niabella agricola TaxID=2891571 RepID=UPI001F328F0E|nr:hypothetical protein [Niabella agricola]MCF3110650.1 hypothetical protein [Niabella agricola]